MKLASLFDEISPPKFLPGANVCGALWRPQHPTHNEASTPNFQTTDKWTDPHNNFTLYHARHPKIGDCGPICCFVAPIRAQPYNMRVLKQVQYRVLNTLHTCEVCQSTRESSFCCFPLSVLIGQLPGRRDHTP